MSLDWLVPLIAAFAALFLGIVVVRSASSLATRQAFFILSASLVLWNVNFVILYGIHSYDLAWQLTRLTRNGAMLLPAAILHLSISLLAQRPRHLRRLLYLDYAYSVGLCLVNDSDYLVSELAKNAWGYHTVGGPLYDMFTLSVVFNFALSSILLIREYAITSDARVRLQLRFWVIGLVVAVPLGLTNLLPPYGVPIYPLGSLGSVAWVGIVAYAIVRHRLMDIHVAITKGIAYGGVIVLIIGPAFAATIWMQWLAFGSVHYDFSVAILAVLIAVGVAFPWVKAKAEQRVQQSLFRERYESRLELDRFGRKLVQILDQKALVAELCQTLIRVFQSDAVVLYLGSSFANDLLLTHWEGRRPTTASLPPLSPQLQRTLGNREALLRAELIISEDRTDQLSRYLQTNGFEVCLPLISEGIGAMLVLGRKLALEPYTAGDLELLSTVGAQAGIALENSRLYGELRKSQEVIRRAGRLSALGTLAAGIAHEIRNPLVSIQTFFQLAPARVHDEEFLTSFLKLTESEVRRITDLITDLLNFAKSPSPVIREHTIDAEIDGAIALVAPQARSQRVELSVQHGKDVPPILGDPDQLRQVLINLVLNAIQATTNGGRVQVATEAAEVDDTVYCVVRVRDTGAGIPAELQEDIFNPFFTTKVKGTGLGLAVSHQIVKEHGGFITVDSNLGEGAQFSVYLPSAQRTSQTQRPRHGLEGVSNRKSA